MSTYSQINRIDPYAVYIAFSYDKTSIVSWIIRLLTWSRYSHVAIIDPKTTWVVEADHVDGVKYNLLSKFFKTSTPEIRKLACKAPDLAVKFAKSQLGRPYDLGFIFGWLFRRDWQDNTKWACSELVAWAVERAGTFIFSEDRMNRITPEHLYMISQKTEDIEIWD